METLSLASGIEALLDAARDARFVLLGEATHGTHEFYAFRAELTQRLVAEHGFAAVTAEADWPDAYRVNRYVRGGAEYTTAEAALRGFRRFPAWMWRNTVVVELVQWLRDHNVHTNSRAGFYGLDLYSLHASIDACADVLARGRSRSRRPRARTVLVLRNPFASSMTASRTATRRSWVVQSPAKTTSSRS